VLRARGWQLRSKLELVLAMRAWTSRLRKDASETWNIKTAPLLKPQRMMLRIFYGLKIGEYYFLSECVSDLPANRLSSDWIFEVINSGFGGF
jgi:hypothetical protein